MTTTVLHPKTATTGNTVKRLLWVAPLAMLASAAANLALYGLAGVVAPEVTAWPGAGVGQIIGATCVYLFMGAVVLLPVARFSNRPGGRYIVVATIALLLSLVLPISAGLGYGAPGAPPASTATVVTLSLMHVVAYAISVPLYVRGALR